jgi:pyruvate dehydrogenase E1 component alpha subunit
MPLTSLDLGDLADPHSYHQSLDIRGADPGFLRRALRDMLLIRLAEEAIGDWVIAGVVRAPCHLGIGQEAVAVGVAAHLRKTDRVFGGHRSHSHFLAMGGDLYGLLAEVLGKVDGASRGMGGSMHLFAQEVGFYGSVPLVGATIPIATGAALAAKLDRSGDVAVAFFGDGATEEGVFHESLNLASSQALPAIFVCENNLFSSHLDIHLRQPSNSVARFAEAHRVMFRTVDGNDVVQVARAAAELVDNSRSGGGPGFLEAVTYRHRGHVGPNEDLDVGVMRSVEGLAAWKGRDPIRRLSDALLQHGVDSEASLDEQLQALRDRVAAAVQRARAADYPPATALLGTVFATGRAQ